MRLSPYQLDNALKQGNLPPVFHLFGAEPLVIEEALTTIRTACVDAGFAEREKYTVEPGFDWDRLLASNQAMSLFASKKRIELRMPSGKPGDAGSKALMAYCEALSTDNVLIVVSGEIEKRAQKAKWFQALEAVGAVVEASEIKGAQIEKWIAQRLSQHGLQFEAEVPTMIAHYVEGNLLAAAQQISQLALLTEGKVLSGESIKTLVLDQARFTNFAYVDACLAGKAARSVRILASLQREQAEPVLLLWALARETRKLAALAGAKLRGETPNFQRLGIWSSRADLMRSALARFPPKAWLHLHAEVAAVDRKIKGQLPSTYGDVWADIDALGLRICGVR